MRKRPIHWVQTTVSWKKITATSIPNRKLSERGAKLLHDAHPALPVVTKPADGRGEIFELEARACGIYALTFPDPAQRRGDMDYKATPFVLK